MTPEEKLRLARRSYAAFNDGLDIEALIPLYDPACEWTMSAALAVVSTASYTGHEGLRSLVQMVSEAVSSYRTEIVEARIAAEGKLLIKNHLSATSAVVGAEVSRDTGQEVEFRDGLILRVTDFDEPPPGWDTAEPLTLPGLEE